MAPIRIGVRRAFGARHGNHIPLVPSPEGFLVSDWP
jgi:hypothetical protein